MFDPYRVYERKQKKTHKGQIIQKKPVALFGSVSRDDFGTISSYADALGYSLIKKYINPFLHESLTFSDAFYGRFNLPAGVNDITQKDISHNIKDLACMQLISSSTFKIISFDISIIIE